MKSNHFNTGKYRWVIFPVLIIIFLIFICLAKYLSVKEYPFLSNLSNLIAIAIPIGTAIIYLYNRSKGKNNSGTVPLRSEPIIIPTPYDFFIGRDSYVTTLLNFFTDPNNELKALLLYSPGGVGKTALSSHVVKELQKRHEYDSFCWISNKESTYDLEGDEYTQKPQAYLTYNELILDIGRKLRIEGASFKDVELCEQNLFAYFLSHKVLLVLDGIENKQRFEEIINKLLGLFDVNSKSRLLVSSREFFEIHPGKSIKLTNFSREETFSFIDKFIETNEPLKTIVKSKGTTALDTIYEATKGNPLTLKVLLSHLLFSSDYDKVIIDIQGCSLDGLNQYLFKENWDLLEQDDSMAIRILKLLADTYSEGAKVDEFVMNFKLENFTKELKKSIMHLLNLSFIEAFIDPDYNIQRFKLHSNILAFVRSKTRSNVHN